MKKGMRKASLAVASLAVSAGILPVAAAALHAPVKGVLEEGAKVMVAETLASTVEGDTIMDKNEPTLFADSVVGPTISATPVDKTVNMLEGAIYQTTSSYRKCKSEEFMDDPRWGTDWYAPVPVQMAWEAEEGAQYYTVQIATNRDFTDAAKYVTFDTQMILNDLFMGKKYYYQIIVTYADKTVKSRIFEFETAYLPRTIYLEGVSNTRDAGGYKTTDKKHRVRQGMVYRGGMLEGITPAAKEKALKTFGIKTDLDLRAEATASPLGNTVNFINVSGPYYGGASTTGTGIGSLADSSRGPWKGTYRDALVTEIRAFANPDNYPIYVHCSLGRDRTGTLIFLINALCGVGEMDLFMDYEISFFSVKGCADNQTPSNMVGNNFGSMYNYLKNYKPGITSMKQQVEQFMLDIGITQDEIDSIRNILVEDL